MTIGEKVKKYEELGGDNIIDIRYPGLFKDLQATVRALEVARDGLVKISKRPDLPNPECDADWKNCMKCSAHEAAEILVTINEILGEK